MIFKLTERKGAEFSGMDFTLKIIYTKHFYLSQNVHLTTPR